MRTIIPAAILAFILGATCSPMAAQTSQPTYLFLLEGKGVPTGTIHVFSVNSLTGGISEVPGSPFNAGLTPQYLALDPSGRFLYVANQQSNDITAFSVNSSNGSLTELPGSPFPIGSQPVAMGIDPTGRFLYVSASSATARGIYEFTIDGIAGVLTPTPGSPQALFATSINFGSVGNFAYLAQGSPNSSSPSIPISVCAIDFLSGLLTPVGMVQPVAGGANVATVSPHGNFLYSVDSVTSELDAFAVSSGGASLVETSGSPSAVPFNPYSLVVHPSGNFLYVVNENHSYQPGETPGQYVGSISGFAIPSGSAGLTQLSGSPIAAGVNPLSIVIDPTGSFAYTTSTIYTSGFTGFAQIMGFSINPSSGALTPLPSAPWTDMAQSTGGALAISHGPPTALNPVPTISSLSPTSTVASGVAFTLQVNGANFVPGATVYFEGQARTTTFVNSAQLNANILGTDINNGGTALVFVFNPLPGSGASTSIEFLVSTPLPAISSINPSSITAGGISFALAVMGSNFVTSSVINVNNTGMTTKYLSPTLLETVFSVADIASPGTDNISVTNPSNGVTGGGISNTLTLTILPPNPLTQPVVSSISPTSATAGGPQFTLTVNGSGFVSGSIVSFNLNNVATSFVSATQLTASIPMSAIAIAGNPYVIVTNPDGFASVSVTFTINNPQPSGISVFPPSLPAGSNALTLNVTGTGFVNGCVVLVGGASRKTTFESPTSLQALLLPGDLAKGGTLDITVMNPPPGGGTTGVISFIVADYSVTPPSASPPVPAGQTAMFPLTVSPSNGAFSYPVTFSISSSTPLPAGTAASFAPSATITPGATPQTVTLSISTTAHTDASVTILPPGLPPGLPSVCFFGVAFALAGLLLRASGNRAPRLAPQLLFAILIVAALGLVACGAVGTGPSSTPQLNPATGTPAGTYSIQIMAVSGGVSHSASVTLTIM